MNGLIPDSEVHWENNEIAYIFHVFDEEPSQTQLTEKTIEFSLKMKKEIDSLGLNVELSHENMRLIYRPIWKDEFFTQKPHIIVKFYNFKDITNGI